MVCLRTFGTPHAHTYDCNLGFLRAVGGGKGHLRKHGQICQMLRTCYSYQLRHSQMLGHAEDTFKSRYDVA